MQQQRQIRGTMAQKTVCLKTVRETMLGAMLGAMLSTMR
jgi:hypothetical protein